MYTWCFEAVLCRYLVYTLLTKFFTSEALVLFPTLLHFLYFSGLVLTLIFLGGDWIETVNGTILYDFWNERRLITGIAPVINSTRVYLSHSRSNLNLGHLVRRRTCSGPI